MKPHPSPSIFLVLFQPKFISVWANWVELVRNIFFCSGKKCTFFSQRLKTIYFFYSIFKNKLEASAVLPRQTLR